MSSYKPLRLPERSISHQLNNKATWNQGRSQQAAHFYTFGYAGREIGEIISSLEVAHVETVIDVRFTPISQYRPQFSKENLRRLLERAGIQYVHRPDLGVPRDVRCIAVAENSRFEIWQWYDTHVVPHFGGKNLFEFFNIADHPVAFMCVERDPSACHRHRLALALEKHGLLTYDL